MPRVPFFEILRGARRTGTDCVDSIPEDQTITASGRVMIVGNPNVGKSVLFNRLTGRYVVVSNYPGTTVEVSRGKMEIGGRQFEVVDTPGMYSLRPLSDEERVGRALLLREHADIVLHVADAKNLDRMLPFTCQLVEAGLPVILVVNMLDESDKLGIAVNLGRLSGELGIPVVGTVALSGRGMDELRNTLNEYASAYCAPAAAV